MHIRMHRVTFTFTCNIHRINNQDKLCDTMCRGTAEIETPEKRGQKKRKRVSKGEHGNETFHKNSIQWNRRRFLVCFRFDGAVGGNLV